jgi:phosphatidylinositol glycan class V
MADQAMSRSEKAVTNTAGRIDPRGIEMLPHAVHALVIALILIFASHTQIALRVVPTVPFMHWSVAGLFIRKPGPAKAWMCWCIIWWAVSCVLWGAFLPPA